MLRRNKITSSSGFTLLEILVALFIFTILSMLLVSALHNIINIQSRTETSAAHLRELQITLLTFSRDIEQAVERPIKDNNGADEQAFIGTPTELTLSVAGLSNPTGELLRSAFQRVSYNMDKDTLYRVTWPVLDRAPDTKPHKRALMNDLDSVEFEYLDKEGKFHHEWPPAGQNSQALPKAVKIHLTISNWGEISQLYVISAEPLQTSSTTSS